MTRYSEGLKLMEEYCGHAKDNIIALSTITTNSDGHHYPCVREVDALYEGGIFYVITWAKSNKMLQIEENETVAFSVSYEGISGNGVARNLGWVLKPENAKIRSKLRNAFSDWYEEANNEQDEDCVILAIEVTHGRIFKDHGETCYNLDFINKLEISEEK